MKVESSVTRGESPAAVRPADWADPGASIGSDVRAAMGLGLDFADEKDTEKAQEKKKEDEKVQTASLVDDFGNSS
jgi:hypothetical protein